jgi:putative membrane protein
MRRRVFEGRAPAGTTDLPTADIADAAPVPERKQTLLHLPLRELLLLGLLDNRGLLVVGAAYGVLWETGLQRALWERLTGGRYAAGLLSDAARRLADGQLPPLWQIGVVAGGLLGLIVLVRLLSMLWVSVTLYDFRLERVGHDLRTEYGLLTRVTTTIPIARIQGLTVHDSPLQRRLGRASVRVDTAGGRGAPGGAPARPRERLAPVIRAAAVPELVRQVMPHGDPGSFDWQPLHPRAFRRAVAPMLLAAGVSSIIVVAFIDVRWWPVMLAGTAMAVLITHQQVRHLAWAVHDDAVAVRHGWLWRTLAVTPVARIQAVSSTESPFDRRTGMAGVRVDNAAAGGAALGMNIPYLARETARALAARLATGAAQTTFRW